MKRIYVLMWSLLALAVASCTDNGLEHLAVAERSYEADASLLSRFVDIDRVAGQYVINPDKKLSPLSYVTNRDYEELQSVSPANYQRFADQLAQLNRQLAGTEADYVLFSTYDGVYLKPSGRNVFIRLQAVEHNGFTRAVSPYAPLRFYPGQETQAGSVPQGRVLSDFLPNLSSEVGSGCCVQLVCRTLDSTPEQTVRVLLSGFGLERTLLVWNADERWAVTTYGLAPSVSDGYIGESRFYEE